MLDERIEEKIVIPVYYAEIEGKKVIDEYSIKKEFEAKLKKAGLYFGLEEIEKRIKATNQKAEMNDLEMEKERIKDEINKIIV